MPQYCVVRMGSLRTIAVVKAKWIENANCAVVKNDGIPRTKVHKVFFSPVAVENHVRARFDLVIRDVFDESITANYLGYVLHTFDSHAQAIEYAVSMSRLRRLIPVNYREKREKQDTRNEVQFSEGTPNQMHTDVMVPPSSIHTLRRELLIKAEAVSHLKNALYIQNIQRDKGELEVLTPSDVDELDNYLDDSDDDGDGLSTPQLNQLPTDDDDDDLILVDQGHTDNMIKTGVPLVYVDNEFSLQYGYVLNDAYDRFYTQPEIKLHLPVVDKLKQWNIRKNNIGHDKQFLNLLLINIFGVDFLKSDEPLAANKLRFMKDLYSKRIKKDVARGIIFSSTIDGYRRRLRFKHTIKQQKTERKRSVSTAA